jgi:hypothetical protein
MKRKTFDLILTLGGGMLVIVLVVAGILLMWGSSFANSNVHNQLAKQDIFFPTTAAFAHAKPGTEITPTMKPYLLPYAGQQLLTGTQAQAYATHFIAIHLSEMPYGGVYSKISTASRANPSTAKLAALVTTSFQGTTLRGLLLEAYAFSVFGTIAFWAGIAAFVLAFLMLILTGLGLLHLRRVPEDAEFPARHRAEVAAA